MKNDKDQKKGLQRLEKTAAWLKILVAVLEVGAAVLFILILLATLKSCGANVDISKLFKK